MRTLNSIVVRFAFFVFSVLATVSLHAGALIGHVRDMNWFAQYQSNPYGVGYYELAVNANASNNATLGGFAATDVFGAFTMANLPAGNYTVASWDVWWRPAYAFNVNVPANGNSADVDLRLKATMWGYPAFWDDAGYREFGQTFVATGPISMIYLRSPLNTSYTLTVHENGPGGAQVGATRTFNGTGDHRLIYGYGDMPTIAGRTYYVRIRTSSAGLNGVIMQMDPRPDFSDPMPGGCLWLGDGNNMVPYPDRDLGLIIMSDDDGLITNLYTRGNGNSLDGTSVGQTFIARGVSLISAAFWLADPAAPTYVVRVFENGPGGAQVGTTKRGKPARLGADPEMIVTWAPGECPLTPGNTYYVEVTRDGGGVVNVALANNSNPFPFGMAFHNGSPLAGTDLAGTLMEEQSPDSATMPAIQFVSDPAFPEANRSSNSVRIAWNTVVASDSTIEFAAHHPPYTERFHDNRLVNIHNVTLSNLQPHTLYHLRVSSAREGYRPAASRDLLVMTKPAAPNLLRNPGFEEGSGTGPTRALVDWVSGGSADIKEANGNWFYSMPPRAGGWLLQGAVNGGSSDGYIYQRVSGVIPGEDYTFSAWVTTWPRENGTLKYDVWNNQGRLIYMRLGMDPTGGTNPNASTVQWTPRFYSHRRWNPVAKTVLAQSSNLTVFVSMKGEGVEWHLYGVDDTALTHEEIPLRLSDPTWSNGVFHASVHSRAGRSNLIERSVNLTNWQTVTSFINSNGNTHFQDNATNAAQFYRARLQCFSAGLRLGGGLPAHKLAGRIGRVGLRA